MPAEAARNISDGVFALHTHTAGGRIRFVTDSPYVAIKVCYGDVGKMPHFTLIGSAGLDMYVREDGKEIYSGSFMPPFDVTDSFEQLIEFKNNYFAAPEKKDARLPSTCPHTVR